MRLLLDTDVCSEFARRPTGLAHRFMQHSGSLAVSAVTVAELMAWVERRGGPIREAVEEGLLPELQLLTVDLPVARAFGRLNAQLAEIGIGVATPDLLIAATAITHDLTLVTHNIKHFERVPGLRVVDWLAD